MLPSKGFELEDEGDHYVLRFAYKGLIGGIGTIVSRGSGYKDYSDRLLGDMSRHLRVTRAELNGLIDCDMDGPSYVSVLRAAGHIREPKPEQDLPKKKK